MRCIVCGSERIKGRFEKISALGESFRLVRCRDCGLEFLNPRPGEEDIKKYYERDYFTKRTDRGYDNYFSPELRTEIERVIRLNLTDLGFFVYEQGLPPKKRALDIGCAAGYFVNFLKERGWRSEGVDVSQDCVAFARGSGLEVRAGDYRAMEFRDKFHLITLWATIEHLHHPDKILEKVRGDLAEGGRLYISTCRSGGVNFKGLFGPRWRFYNFPEHLFYFSRRNLGLLLEREGFAVERCATYGSGLGTGGSLLRKVADFIAKRFYMGDMMLVSARKS